MCIAAWELTTTVWDGNLNRRLPSDPAETRAPNFIHRQDVIP
jgi:hypothetical protein